MPGLLRQGDRVSSDASLTLLHARDAGIRAVLALDVLVFKLPAFCFAGFADLNGRLCKGLQVLGIIGGQLRQRFAGDHQFLHLHEAFEQLRVAAAHVIDAMRGAGVARLDTVERFTDQRGMRVAVMLMFARLGRGCRHHGRGCCEQRGIHEKLPSAMPLHLVSHFVPPVN